MDMTRRAFFMHPARAVGEDLENAGEWLRRAGQQKGHLTLRPLTWWDRAFGHRFRRRHDARTLAVMANDFVADPSKYLAVYDLVEVPALV